MSTTTQLGLLIHTETSCGHVDVYGTVAALLGLRAVYTVACVSWLRWKATSEVQTLAKPLVSSGQTKAIPYRDLDLGLPLSLCFSA